jgi:hypothetical protein
MHLYQFTLSTSCPVCALNVSRTLFSGGENPETFDINSNIIILPGQSLTLSKEAPAPTGQIHQSMLGQLHTSMFGQLHQASSVNAWPGHQSMLGHVYQSMLGQLHTSKFGQLHLASSINAWPGHQSMLCLVISQSLVSFMRQCLVSFT